MNDQLRYTNYKVSDIVQSEWKDRNLIFPPSSQLCRHLYVSEISLQFCSKKDNKPYIQLSGYSPLIDPFVLNPFTWPEIKSNSFSQNLLQMHAEYFSFYSDKFHPQKSDQVDKLIAMKFSSMVAARAELFQMIRRKPVEGYDITLLITNQILQKYHKDFVIQLIINLVSTLEKDLVEVKLNINTQCRIAATYFMEQLTGGKQESFY